MVDGRDSTWRNRVHGGIRQVQGAMPGEGIIVAYRCRAAAPSWRPYPRVTFALRSSVEKCDLSVCSCSVAWEAQWGTNCGRLLSRARGGTKFGGGLLCQPPLCDIPSGCCSFTGPWTVTRSSLRMLRRVAAFCRPLRPVLLLVSFPRSRSPVVGVLGLC